MANRPRNERPNGCISSSSPSQSFSEPEVRRWPHPVNTTGPAVSPDAALHYVNCALSYQNQLLSDIKSLLEQIKLNTSSDITEK